MATLNFNIQFTSNSTAHSGCHIVMAWFVTNKNGKENLIAPQDSGSGIVNNVPYMWLVRHPSNLPFKDYTNYDTGLLQIPLNYLNNELDCWINNSCDPNMLLKVAVIPCCALGIINDNRLQAQFNNACPSTNPPNTCAVPINYPQASLINLALTNGLLSNGGVTYIKITNPNVKRRCKRYRIRNTNVTNSGMSVNSNIYPFNVSNLNTCSNYFNNPRTKILSSAGNVLGNSCIPPIRVNWQSAMTTLHLCADPTNNNNPIINTGFPGHSNLILTELDYQREEDRSTYCCYDCQQIGYNIVLSNCTTPPNISVAIIYQSCLESNYGQLTIQEYNTDNPNCGSSNGTIHAIPGTVLITAYDSTSASSTVLPENLNSFSNPVLGFTPSSQPTCNLFFYVTSAQHIPLLYQKC